MKKVILCTFILFFATAGVLVTQEKISLNLFGISVQDEALPQDLPDYPIQAEPLYYQNQLRPFTTPAQATSPYVY